MKTPLRVLAAVTLLVAVPGWANDETDIVQWRLDAAWMLVEPPFTHGSRPAPLGPVHYITGIDASAPLGKWRDSFDDVFDPSRTKQECLAARLEAEQDRERVLARALVQAQVRKDQTMSGLINFLYGPIDTERIRYRLESIRAAQCVTVSEYRAARRAARGTDR